MHAFEFSIPTRIVFGPGTESRTGELAAGLDAHRVLLVCGGQSARRSGLLDRVEQSLIQAGLACRVFAGIHPNPRLFQVREGVQTALEFGADLILAVGGGSVIDAAKAIALGAARPTCGTSGWASARWSAPFQWGRCSPSPPPGARPAPPPCSPGTILWRSGA